MLLRLNLQSEVRVFHMSGGLGAKPRGKPNKPNKLNKPNGPVTIHRSLFTIHHPPPLD